MEGCGLLWSVEDSCGGSGRDYGKRGGSGTVVEDHVDCVGYGMLWSVEYCGLLWGAVECCVGSLYNIFRDIGV